MNLSLTRSQRDRMLGGVCGGIAERTGMTSSTVRLLFVLSCLLPGPQLIIYLALWILLPEASAPQPPQSLPAANAYPAPAPPPSQPMAGEREMPRVGDVTRSHPPHPTSDKG